MTKYNEFEKSNYRDSLFLSTGQHVHPVGHCVPAGSLAARLRFSLQQMAQLHQIQVLLQILVLGVASSQHFRPRVRIDNLIPQRTQGHVGPLGNVKQLTARWLCHDPTPQWPQLQDKNHKLTSKLEIHIHGVR